MSTITIDERSALVLIDLQNGILALPTLVDPDDFKDRTRRLTLAAAFRANALPVVEVKLAWSADEVIFRPVEPSSPADR
jgi:nicotinamidase-related amidase